MYLLRNTQQQLTNNTFCEQATKLNFLKMLNQYGKANGAWATNFIWKDKLTESFYGERVLRARMLIV